MRDHGHNTGGHMYICTNVISDLIFFCAIFSHYFTGGATTH